jgi:hypothetical protein
LCQKVGTKGDEDGKHVDKKPGSEFCIISNASIASYANIFFLDRTSWEAALQGARVAPVDIATQVPPFHFLPAGSPLLLAFGETLKFDTRVEGLQVPSSRAT